MTTLGIAAPLLILPLVPGPALLVDGGCTLRTIRVGGKDLDAKKVYTVVTNDDLAGGGSGFAGLGPDPNDAAVRYDLHLRHLVARALGTRGAELLAGVRAARVHPRQVVRGRCRGAAGHGA